MSDPLVRSYEAVVYLIPSKRPEGATHIVTIVPGADPPFTLCATCDAGRRGHVCWAQLEAAEREAGTFAEPAPAWAIMHANGAR